MTYEAKPGSFSLFKNADKQKDTNPDYKGEGKDLDGNPIWVDAWIKEGKKGKFMSCSFKLKGAPKLKAKQGPVDDDSTPPF